MSKSIVVLGAGYSGVLIAKGLAKKIKKQKIKNVEVTIIDKNPFHTMLTELHEVAACRVDESSIRIDLHKIFAGRKVNVVMDNIIDANYAEKRLVGKAGTYNYDYLVMASGCKCTYFGVKGAEENSFPLWSYQESVNLRDHIQCMFRGASEETDPQKRKAMLTFYIIGAGFTGVEMAGELAEYTPIMCDKFKLKREDVRIVLVDALDKIMTFLPDKARNRAMKRLDKMGVEVLLKSNVTSVGKDNIEFSSGGAAKKDTTNTVIWAAGTEGSDIALKAESLGLVPRTRGRIQTDKHLRSLEHPNVYVGGDNIFYIPEGEKDPVPQMVENCEHCAPVIATNILNEIAGEKPTKDYKPQFHGAMVCIGGRYGTSFGGLPGKFFVQPSFMAMFAKHFINVIYFFQVLGFNKVLSYITAEFFTIRNKRSFLGGHFSNRSPSVFTFPLRFFTGNIFIYYFYRRFADVRGSWFQEDMLTSYFDNLRRVYPTLIDLPFLSWFRLMLYGGEGGYMHVLLQVRPVSWFMNTFVIASQGTIMFWQAVIVISTILFGLALVAGMFTTLSSFYVIIYALVFMLTGGLSLANMWLLFAGIAIMFTGSKSLSIDYYFMPWLKKKWKNTRWVKKSYLYID